MLAFDETSDCTRFTNRLSGIVGAIMLPGRHFGC